MSPQPVGESLKFSFGRGHMVGKGPYIALPLNDENFEERLTTAYYRGVDIIEFRIDLLKKIEKDYIIDHLRKIKEKGLKTILTIRAKWEGGGHEINDKDRLKIFNYCIDLIDYLDIEFSSMDIIKDVVDLARRYGKDVIISFHDFDRTPSEEFLQKLIDKSFELGADITKLSLKVNSEDDVGRILSISYKNKLLGRKLIAIGMGELGKITRVAGYFFGSIITYTYIGKSVAPGQIEINKLLEELKFYGLR